MDKTAIEVYEKYFKYEYASYDSFYGAIIREGKIKSKKIGKLTSIKEKDVLKFLNKQKRKHQIKILWMDILDDINNNKKLEQASVIINRKYQVLYSVLVKNSLGDKLIKLLSENKKELKQLRG